MGRCRVVKPEIVRLPISDGDYLDVKKTLNAGEYRDLLAEMSTKDTHFGDRPVVDMKKLGITKVLQYLVGWSLMGFDEKPLPYSLDMSDAARISTLRSLDQDTFAEIVKAIDDHEEKEEQDRVARKNGQAGESASSATSLSASA
jgi:hypothetical protein